MLKFVLGLVILLGVQAAGQAITDGLHLFLPGTLTGTLLLAVLLAMGALSPGKVQSAANQLLDHIPLFFIPLAVGIVDVWELLREQLLVVSIVVVASTLIVMLMTGLTTQFLINKLERTTPKGGEEPCGKTV